MFFLVVSRSVFYLFISTSISLVLTHYYNLHRGASSNQHEGFVGVLEQGLKTYLDSIDLQLPTDYCTVAPSQSTSLENVGYFWLSDHSAPRLLQPTNEHLNGCKGQIPVSLVMAALCSCSGPNITTLKLLCSSCIITVCLQTTVSSCIYILLPWRLETSHNTVI